MSFFGVVCAIEAPATDKKSTLARITFFILGDLFDLIEDVGCFDLLLFDLFIPTIV